MPKKIPALVLGALLPVLAQAAEAPPTAPPPPSATATEAKAEGESGWSVSAIGREEYRYRTSPTPKESDHLVRLGFDLDAASPADSFGLKATVSAWYYPEDSRVEGEPFGLMRHRQKFSLNVYELNAEWRPSGVLKNMRLGRQETEHGQLGTFDGLSITLQPLPMLRIFAFGGRSAHFFELDQGVFEDFMGSAGVELRGENWRLEADYRLMKEDVASNSAGDPGQAAGEQQKVGITDHSYGLTGWYRHGDWFNARLSVRGVNSTLSLVGAAVRAEWLAQHLGAELKVDVQPMELGELNELDNPFYLTLGVSKPHLKAKLDVYKGFDTSAGQFALHLGGSLRQLLEGSESAFNRNLMRVYLLASADHLGGTGLFVHLVGQFDQANSGNGVLSAGGALGWDQRPLRAELGTSYYRYQYVYYQSPEELADVREFYADVKVNVLHWLAVRARYSYQIFDRNLHTVTVSLVEAY